MFAADLDRRALDTLKAVPGVVPVLMDVTSARDVAKARRRVERDTDGLDGLVCAAGLFSAAPLVETVEDDLVRTLQVNLVGAFRAVREFFPLLHKRSGTVVIVGSECTRCAMPFTGAYAISKSGLDAFAEVLRREAMFLGVRVAIVQPGAIRTPLLGGVQAEMEKAAAGTQFADQLARVRRILPREWDKGMQPEKVAAVVVRALHAHRPRARYRVGNDPLRAALGMLPARVADTFIRCFM